MGSRKRCVNPYIGGPFSQPQKIPPPTPETAEIEAPSDHGPAIGVPNPAIEVLVLRPTLEPASRVVRTRSLAAFCSASNGVSAT